MIRKFDTAYFMISVSVLEDNKAFAEKEHADFPLLANPDKKVALAYGVVSPEAPPERQLARRRTGHAVGGIGGGRVVGPEGDRVLFRGSCRSFTWTEFCQLKPPTGGGVSKLTAVTLLRRIERPGVSNRPPGKARRYRVGQRVLRRCCW